jgi:paraquat-inducible protein B
MAVKANPKAVGAFILGAVALLVAAVVVLGGDMLFKRQVRVVAFFDGSVAGLSVGAPVNVRGVRIGSVSNIILGMDARSGAIQIPVYMELEPDRVTFFGGTGLAGPAREGLVRAGLRAQLVSQSMVTGLLEVELEFHPDTPARMVSADPSVPEIPTLPSEFDQIRNALSRLPLQQIAEAALRSLNALDGVLRSPAIPATLNQVQSMLTEAHPVILATLRNLDDATAQVRQLAAQGQVSLQAIQDGLSGTLASTTRLMADTDRQLLPAITDLRGAIRTLDATMLQAQAAMATVSGMVAPRSQLRLDLDALVRNLAAAAASIRGLADMLERNPNALLTGRSPR